MCQTTTSPEAVPAAVATEEILPCPFCGNSPTFDQNGGGEHGILADMHLIGCLDEDCGINPIAEGQTRKEAIAVWNTRALQVHTAETEGDPVREKATLAVGYVLMRIAEEPELGYRMGAFTQAFELLTEAYAAHRDRDLEEVRKEWLARFSPRRLDAHQRLQVIFDIADKTLSPVERKRVYQELHDEISSRLQSFGEEE